MLKSVNSLFYSGEIMACGLALKRPLQHEYESFLTDESYNGEAKRARTQCPPFRAQMGTIAATLPSTSTFAQKFKEQVSITTVTIVSYIPRLADLFLFELIMTPY